MSIDLRLLESRDCWSPGDTVEAEVEWSSVEPVEEVEIRMLWEITGRGDEEEGVVRKDRVSNPGTSSGHQFEFVLPQAPWSFDGELITLTWYLDAVLWPSGEHTRTALTLSPTGSTLVPLVDASGDLMSQIPEGRGRAFAEWLELRFKK